MAASTKELPKRSTRGGRVFNELLGEEKEIDDAFWGQDFFRDDDNDEDYSTEKEVPDKYDDDFFSSESDESTNEEKEPPVKPEQNKSSTKGKRKVPVLRKSKWKGSGID
jgi:hypothetical protein